MKARSSSIPARCSLAEQTTILEHWCLCAMMARILERSHSAPIGSVARNAGAVGYLMLMESLEGKEQFFRVERPGTLDVSYPNTHERLHGSSHAYEGSGSASPN